MQVLLDPRVIEQLVHARRGGEGLIMDELQIRRELHLDLTAEAAAQELRRAVQAGHDLGGVNAAQGFDAYGLGRAAAAATASSASQRATSAEWV